MKRQKTGEKLTCYSKDETGTYGEKQIGISIPIPLVTNVGVMKHGERDTLVVN